MLSSGYRKMKIRRTIKKLVGEDLYIFRGIRLTPVRNHTIVHYKGMKIIASQTQYEYYKSKLMNHWRSYKRSRSNG